MGEGGREEQLGARKTGLPTGPGLSLTPWGHRLATELEPPENKDWAFQIPVLVAHQLWAAELQVR